MRNEWLALDIALAPPAPARIEDGARLADAGERLQCVVDDTELLGAVARLTQGVAERPAEMHGARWAHLLGNIAQANDAHGGDAGGFDDTGDQSHGLIA